MKTVESCLKIRLSDLKKAGLLKPSGRPAKAMQANYTNNRGEVISSILIDVRIGTEGEEGINLYYQAGDQLRDYFIKLVRRPSNLGKGFVYYFVCPLTEELCRVLLAPQGLNIFASRKAFTGLVYEIQTVSRLAKLGHQERKFRQQQNDIFKPYMKTSFKGEPTSTVRRWHKKKRKADRAEEARLRSLYARLCSMTGERIEDFDTAF